jgi:hypothetical protein
MGRTDVPRLLCRFPLVATLSATVACSAAGGLAQTSEDETAIRAASAAYQQALDRGDGKALAALWTADGDIVDGDGNLTKGRDTVSLVAEADPASRKKFRIRDLRLRFIAPGVAIEDGIVELPQSASSAASAGRFSATWVKQSDGWKLAGVRESQAGQSGAEQLQDLDWMVGDWTVENGGGQAGGAGSRPTTEAPTIEVMVRWNANRTYLLRDMKITPPAAAGKTVPIQVSQRIGWDPLSHQIRSWVFSADGGHGEAFWRHDGDSWVARTTAVLPDGSQTSSINVYTYDGKDRCTWQSLHTHAGSEHLPPVNMTLIRKPGRTTP